MSNNSLFQPFSFKSLRLPNRIVMAPMTRGFSPGGVTTEDVAGYYARRAAGEVGLILSEGTGIGRPGSLNGFNYPRFHGEKELAAWKRVIDAVHADGGAMAPQIWHVGAVPPLGDGPPAEVYESPSGLSAPDKPLGKVMTEQDIADTIEAFGTAAADAKRLGFDAVEIHGAHGYLIDQFFWESTNKRQDAYGGTTITERNRFAVDVLRSIRSAVGPDFPVILRVSQWKLQDYTARIAKTPEEMEKWLQPLVDAGADILHCSQRRFWDAEFEGSDLNFAGWAKKITGVPTITVGSVGLNNDVTSTFGGESSQPAPLEELERRLDRGDFDLVAVGRAILQDPQWTAKVREGRTSDLSNFEVSAMGSLS